MTTHKTSNGRPFDMGAFIAQNEGEVALGNMRVNAKGDKLGKGGKVVETAQQRVQKTVVATTSNQTASLKDAVQETPATDDQAKSQVKPVRKRKEIIKDDGSIEVMDPTTDEGNNL